MSIKKEFIPYQEALELRKLGFDEPCLGFYERGKELVIQECEITDFHSNSLQCVAPTFSQAFRWFREKYGWVAEIHGSLQINRFYANLLLQAKGEVNNIKMCDTYEEAELACLRKLIEIVKENNG